MDSSCHCRYSRRKRWTLSFVEEHSEGFVHTVFNQPAGHVECGETLTEAAIRETLEETGHHIDIDALLGIYTYTPYVSGPYLLSLLLLAHVTHVESDPKLDTGIVSAVWMTLDELKESARARSPLVIKAIEDAMKGQHYPLALIYEHPFSPSLTSHLDA